MHYTTNLTHRGRSVCLTDRQWDQWSGRKQHVTSKQNFDCKLEYGNKASEWSECKVTRRIKNSVLINETSSNKLIGNRFSLIIVQKLDCLDYRVWLLKWFDCLTKSVPHLIPLIATVWYTEYASVKGSSFPSEMAIFSSNAFVHTVTVRWIHWLIHCGVTSHDCFAHLVTVFSTGSDLLLVPSPDQCSTMSCDQRTKSTQFCLLLQSRLVNNRTNFHGFRKYWVIFSLGSEHIFKTWVDLLVSDFVSQI